ncbi:DUF3014 domain-containing protein [Hydrogenophaga palleronii]|uniref:DUF3014 domain-containing protein n=1 Tax=Hydrogenophaga palleronii TaxID=65655 RepID=UPI000826FAF6|nr:DUF3014 domain-containing protein [Hydrogenophaga palleronii]
MRPPSPPQPSWLPTAGIVALIVLAVAGYFGWLHYQAANNTPATVEAPASPAPELPATPQATAPVSEPAIQHPVEEPVETTGASPLPRLADADALVTEALTGLVTRKNVLSFFQVDGFVRRAVATVDNLPRTQAPTVVWPVNPTPQRFTTVPAAASGQPELIAPANSQRYTPLVNMVEAVDTAQAVAVYRRLYPLFQQAYEELGFPGRYFNDRLVQVLDHLIATPPLPAGPVAVKLVEVKGEVPSTRPWVRYEFADPALEAASAGRKILWRIGADNQQRLQAKLKDIRQRVARP